MSLTREALEQILHRFSGRALLSSELAFAEYTHDATEIEHAPDLVVLAESPDDVCDLVKLSVQFNFPIIARGAGTGYSGGAVATHGGVVLSLEKMNRILSIDPGARTALVEPGVITHDLDLAANNHGLFYPPDPASHKESTLGGNLAECAGGLRCVKYGVTRDYVRGVVYVDYTGAIRYAGSLSQKSTSCDVMPLLIGSEGTLGIITKIELRLIPLPECTRSFLFAFDSENDAAGMVAAIRKAGIVPCALEFMDGEAIACAIEYLKPDDMPKADALLLVEVDGTAADVDREAEAVGSIARDFKPSVSRTAFSAPEREHLWQIRRELSTAVKSFSKVKTSEDVCVPISKFPQIVKSIREIGARQSLRVASFGHAGDGNLHVCFIIPELTEEILSRLSSAREELLHATLALGGTISGEHGIGFTKKKYLVEEVGEDGIELFKLIKRSFDPDNRINPGKIC
jgi:glycolate oxidase